ncbi:MAG: HAMP domain-containing histidine kinase [Bacteroidales bacterium]|nr:HAMP domain-containing histidine kinase [Bacteroidales bacterium]MCF8402297.1 HAMP domain-containing histidine kinase [Bacteroidales bacterium]
METKNIGKSLYWRISASFLLLLLLLGLAYILITAFAANRYFKETTQRLNSHVAESMLLEVNPFVDGKVNKEALGKIMHSMMAVNPSLEVYLIDPNGEILSFVVLDKKVKLNAIDLEPVKEFINYKGENYILGDDPRNPGEKTIFSATEVIENGNLLGYVYMVLVSEKYENVTTALLSSYWLRVGTNAFILTLLAAFAIGLVLIWIVTKNLRIVINTFRKFEDGDHLARIPENKMKGEMAILSRNFNNMADTILQNIDELKQVDSLRRELIANVSHDLRSPLAVIHGYIETMMIKEDNLSPEERKKYLQIILDGSIRLKNLVADLFELSKLDAKQINLKKEKLFLNELVADAAQHYQVFAEKKHITINSDISESLPMVEADISLMERVIQNLLSNAIQYTPENGQVKINVLQNANEIEVGVENSGAGIPEKDLPHIFDRYYKVGKEKSGIEGTGLGLAIVKKILDLHQIPIQVKSKVNEFTSFRFAIPIN